MLGLDIVFFTVECRRLLDKVDGVLLHKDDTPYGDLL